MQRRNIRGAAIHGAIGVLLGVGSGAVASFDADAWQQNPDNTKGTPTVPLSFRHDRVLDAGLVGTGLGLLGGAFGWPHPDVAHAMLGQSLLLTSQRVTMDVAQRNNKGYLAMCPAPSTGTTSGALAGAATGRLAGARTARGLTSGAGSVRGAIRQSVAGVL